MFAITGKFVPANGGFGLKVVSAAVCYCTPERCKELSANAGDDDFLEFYLVESRPEPEFAELKRMIADAIMNGVLSETMTCLRTYAPGVVTSYTLYNPENPLPD